LIVMDLIVMDLIVMDLIVMDLIVMDLIVMRRNLVLPVVGNDWNGNPDPLRRSWTPI
jgi:hypothetical protein